MKLNPTDLATLRRAVDLRRRFDAGIFPRGSGQYAHFHRLVRLGLLAVTGWGRDIDGETERDVLVHKLTVLGESAATYRDRQAEIPRSQV